VRQVLLLGISTKAKPEPKETLRVSWRGFSSREKAHFKLTSSTGSRRMTTLRVLLTTAFCLAAIAPGTEAQTRPSSNTDFRNIAPQDWTLLPRGSSRGRRFESPRGDAWLWLYAEPADRDSVRDHIESVAFRKGEEITYRRQGGGWIVVSGYHGDRIFYRKAMLACGDRQWHHLEFEYPAAQKRGFDDFVTRASYALKAYEQAGCTNRGMGAQR
jgi:hypothetical protein